MSNASDLQSVIDAKISLLASIVTALADVVANPKVSYSIDGQSVNHSDYQRWLVDTQVKETEALDKLFELKIKFSGPYSIISRAGGWY